MQTEGSAAVGTFRMIAYPFGLGIASLCVVMFLGMALFGLEPAEWAEWQNELVGTIGTIVGFAGVVTGVWLAIRAERQAIE